MTYPALTRRSLIAGTAGIIVAATLPHIANAMPSADEVVDGSVPVFGNPGGDVTIVEVVDYQCGYCKLSYSELGKMMAEDPGVKLVMKDWPVFGPASEFAARALLAYRDQPSVYGAGVAALMNNQRRLSEKRVVDLLEEAGADASSLAQRMESQKPEIDAILGRNAKHAQQFELRGTPAILVGNRLFRRAMPIEDLRKAVAVARQAPADSGSDT